jgi:hypothetical protein
VLVAPAARASSQQAAGTRENAGRDGVQIDLCAGRQQRFLVKDGHALEPLLEEGPAHFLLPIGQS